MTKTYSGFIAIVGPTNAGKSTLINQIMGRKVSIVSHKVQTTRTNLRAVKMVGNRQLIFVDTPGIFRPARRLDRAMVGAAFSATSDADAILLVIDAQKGVTETVRQLVEKIGNHKNLFVALNKVDAVSKPDLLPLTAETNELAHPREIFMISALKNDGIDQMLDALAAVMPAGPYLFDAHDASDVPDNLYLSELTREKIYKYIHQELPYHINVVTERVDVDSDGVLDIYQKIAVQNDAHKKIVIGRGGAQLKKIGTAARHDIQNQWGVNARLHLFVRVEPNWENTAENYTDQGLEFKK
ncbi:MAG TPA: GTPase Era [Candidatus Enterousia intestinigallinarum]|uniref:GTPase Era n=1 Tax=Candidatus Enterousia intestinigallinarum TaxID=2840790 RepID=A0A9D1FGA9_9PROT|nr:GTPase Era [Candidatus Enterousia intestinigallinarum]